jgi:hypothetical protein
MGTSSTSLPHSNPGWPANRGRLLSYYVHELRPHPSYARHKLSVQAYQLAALEDQGDELAFKFPIVITGERFIVDGYARWELAKRQGRSTVLVLEYDLTEGDALQLLIQTHRRSQGLNDFVRIELALDLEKHAGNLSNNLTNQKLFVLSGFAKVFFSSSVPFQEAGHS